MPAPPLSHTYNGGVDGNTILTTDTGNGDAFQAAGIGAGVTMTYSSTTYHSAGLSCKIVQPATGAATGCTWQALGSLSTDVWARFYFWVSINNVADLMVNWQNSTSTVVCYFGMRSDGKLSVLDSAGSTVAGSTSSTVIQTGIWYRCEVRCIPWQVYCDYKLFSGNNIDGITPDEYVSVPVFTPGTAINVDRIKFGHGISSAATMFNNGTGYIDDPAVSATDWIGSSSPASKIWIPNLSLFPKSPMARTT